jgi:chemotaxis protein CheX
VRAATLSMPATEEISECVIRENITRAVGDVFKTMLNRAVKLHSAVEDGDAEPMPQATTPQVVGTVGFIGEACGLIYLYFDQVFAELCTGQMLGMNDFELKKNGDEVVNDAIGELTNMVVGSFKNALCDQGYPCKLTIPSILRGRNFTIGPMSSAQRRIYHFECGNHRVTTDIILKSVD